MAAAAVAIILLFCLTCVCHELTNKARAEHLIVQRELYDSLSFPLGKVFACPLQNLIERNAPWDCPN